MGIQPGETVPPLVLFRRIGEPVFNDELFRDGPTLVHFWLFDFVAGPGAG